MPLTVGTAGHVDHGKTTLVRALTGKDTDRLPEERARGISIELGYAPLELASGRTLSLVDVPGHERFVRTMVAGATGIDLFLLVVDAAEGARPQTHEHLAVLRLLGVEHGVVAVTKADAVDDETLELALEEGRELVPGAPVVAVSGVTGAGLDDLRAALDEIAADITPRRADFPARLFVDRVFTLRGIGTVVTGTLWSGTVAEGDRLRVEPAGRDVRVRSVQVHDSPVERAEAGQRVAVNLPGVERRDLRRGDVLVAPGAFPWSYRLEVALEELDADRRRRAALGASRDEPHRGTRRPRRRLARAAPARSPGGRRPRRSRGAARRDHPRRRRRPRPRAAAQSRRRARPAARRRRPGLDRPRPRPRPGERHSACDSRASRRRRPRGGSRRRPGGRRLGVLGRMARGDGRRGRGAAPRAGRALSARSRSGAGRASPVRAVGRERARPAARRATRAEGVPPGAAASLGTRADAAACARGRSLARRVVRDEGRRRRARTVSRVRGPTRPPRRRVRGRHRAPTRSRGTS